MQLSTSVKTALLIFGVVVLYFGVRTLLPSAETVTEEEAAAPLFPVIAETISPAPWRDEVLVRGRTEALRKVIVRAETAGVIAETPAAPGSLVEEGAPLCRIKIDARRAALNEARAAYAKAKLDHEAAVKLAAEGFRSETGVAAAKAALDLAKASLEQASLAVERTTITAPFAGVFDERLAEVGDYLNVGEACGVLIQQTPFLITGAVAERDVAKISKGDRGVARLATGETIEGVVRFVAASSDAATRTFDVELEVPNEDGALRDGVTAEFTVFAARRDAHLVPRSALTLDDSGEMGVRLVGEGDLVEFARASLLGETADGVWISGLSGSVRLITRGQELVSRGQKVAVTAAGAEG